MKNICIVGAGIFGTTLALILSENKDFKIDLYEKNNDILSETSLKNQQRFHLGYHYPRSKKTILEIKNSSKDFNKFYGNKFYGHTKNIYAISKTKSKLNFDEYCKKLNFLGLETKKKKFDIFSDLVDESIITDEKILNYFKFKKMIKKKLIRVKNINLKLKKTISKKNLSEYDKVIVCTYSNNNILLSKLGILNSKLKKKRYELVEKIVVKMPKELKTISAVILDGNFLNFDPYIGTNYHLLSVVKEAKIEIIKKKFPNFNNFKKRYLKYKFIKDEKNSNFKNFIKFGQKFVPLLSKARYVSSTYVVRCIDISKNNQNRNTIIQRYGNKIITVFSGKWNNCVKVSKQIKKLI
jgi:D-amino-acid oxidase